MREIKYRQKKKYCTPGDIWHYWGYVNNDFGCFVAPLSESQADGESQQFTGLKDKNGREIYEGDIVKKVKESKFSGYIGVVFFAEVRCSFVIKHRSGKFERYEDLGKCRWSEEDGYCVCDLNSDKDERMVIIGNIYENQELLK